MVDTTRQVGVYVTAGVMLTISVTVIVLRLIARRFIVQRVALDDWLMLGGTIFMISYCITSIMMARSGAGLHVVDVPISSLPTFARCLLITEFVYHFTIYFAKCSVLSFYLHFIPPDTKTRRGVWGVIFLISAMMLANLVVLSVQCMPLSHFWDYSVPGRCINITNLIYVSGGINILSDFLIVLLPIKWLLTIRRSFTEKLLIISVFAASFMGCIVGILRMPSIAEFASGQADPTWNVYWLCVWSLSECMIAILCGSAPALKPLFFKGGISGTLTANIELSKSFYDLHRTSVHGSKRQVSVGVRDFERLGDFDR